MANKNNFRRLKEEADIEAVINYLGIETHQKGTAIFILCPNPKHNDSHATNCYFKRGWNNVHCNVCGKSFMALDLIMWTLDVSYGEAADILFEIEGCPEWYHDNSWKNKKDNTKEEFHLSGTEAKLLDIQLSTVIEVPYEYTSYRKYLSDEIPKGYTYSAKNSDGYLLCKKQRITWKDFMDETQFKELIRSRINEKTRIFDAIDKAFDKEIYTEERKILESILKRL